MSASSQPQRARALASRASDMREALSAWLKREHAGQDVPQAVFAARARALCEAWIPEDKESLRGLLAAEPAILKLTFQDVQRLATRNDEATQTLLAWTAGKLGLELEAAYEPSGQGRQPSAVFAARLEEQGLRWQQAFEANQDMVRQALGLPDASPHDLALMMVRRLAVRSLVRELGPIDEIRLRHNQAVEQARTHARQQAAVDGPPHARPPASALETPLEQPASQARRPVRVVSGFDPE